MMKSRRMRWVGHVACMGQRGMHTGFLWGSQNEMDHLDVIVRIILRQILEK
jgi:hypothetical protein